MAVNAVFVLKFEQFRTWNLVSTELGRGTLEIFGSGFGCLLAVLHFLEIFSATVRCTFPACFTVENKVFLKCMGGTRIFQRGSLVCGGCRINGANPHNDVAILKIGTQLKTATPEILAMTQSRNYNELPV